MADSKPDTLSDALDSAWHANSFTGVTYRHGERGWFDTGYRAGRQSLEAELAETVAAHDRMVTTAAEARGAEALATEARLRAEADREAAERELQALKNPSDEVIERVTDLHRLRTGGHFEAVRDQDDEKLRADVEAILAAFLSTTPDTEGPTCDCDSDESYISREGNVECCSLCDRPKRALNQGESL